MPRKNRLFIDGIPHLVKLSGHNDEVIFKDDEDISNLYHCVDNALAIYSIKLHAYSLSLQKITLLLSAPDKESLGRFMQHLGKGYAHDFNHRHQRHGTLWDSRYDCSPVEPNAYFLLVKKYIECHCTDEFSHHSSADAPQQRITPHDEYLRLGENALQRRNIYQQFCLGSMSPAIITRIESALTQNCLLATTAYSKSLEEKLQRNLRPRKIGRPRKHDHNPAATWEWLEKKAEYLLRQYCYHEIRTPLLEKLEEDLTQSFCSDSGELLLNHQALLRGDGTMGCLRLLSQHRNLQTETRVWYQGTMFRRQHQQNISQFHQLGVETFGYSDIGIEIELISLQYDFFKSLQLLPFIDLKVNTTGNQEEFAHFRHALQQYYRPFAALLNAQQLNWLNIRPERLLTDKDSLMQRLAEPAPQLESWISARSRQRFTRLCDTLTALHIPFTHDRKLFPVNNYNDLIFEWHSDAPYRHQLLCRGGRYDHTASQLIGHPVSACGFAFMLEPIMHLLSSTKKVNLPGKHIDLVIIPCQERARSVALTLSRRLRRSFPHLSILNDCSSLRLATRQKNAQRQGARFILLIDGNETEVTFYDEENHDWVQISLNDVVAHLSHSLMM